MEYPKNKKKLQVHQKKKKKEHRKKTDRSDVRDKLQINHYRQCIFQMHMLQGLPSFYYVLMTSKKAISGIYVMRFSHKYILKYKYFCLGLSTWMKLFGFTVLICLVFTL